MTERDVKKYKLSNSILEMKFMKKSKLKADKEKEVEEGHAMFSDAMTDEMKRGESKFIMEPSFIPCEKLILGRLSFHGMNVDIERQMEAEDAARLSDVQVKKETDVSDQEMANQYALIGSVGQKFKTKRETRHQNDLSTNCEITEPEFKKTKFLKPKD